MWLPHWTFRQPTHAGWSIGHAPADSPSRRTARNSCSPCTARSPRSSATRTTTRSKRHSCVHNSTCRRCRRISRCASPNTGCETTGWRPSSRSTPREARGQNARAARLYRAAVDAGAEGLTSRLADALALTGECTTAAALADDLLSSADSAERAAAVRIAASVAVHDGNASQAAELFSWLGPHPDAVVGAAAAITLAATGDLATARVALSAKDAGPPTIAARTSRSLAEGLLLTMDRPYPAAMAKLGQAIAVEQSLSEVIPDSPAALVTLAAIHGGDPVRARSVIGRAVRAGGDSLFDRRHSLLSGWIKMQDGQLPSASADVDAVGSAGLHRRDALWAAALQTAIARRSGDTGALQKHWYAAMEVLAEYYVDLFSLLPLGELWVAAARMRQVDQLRHALDQAFALLDALGNPAVVVGTAALGRRARGNPGQLPGVGRPARTGPHRGGSPQRTCAGIVRCRPDLAAGAGQSSRRGRGQRRCPDASAVRADLGRDAAGRPGRTAGTRRPGVRGHAATGPRPQAGRATAERDARRTICRSVPRPRRASRRRVRRCRTGNARSPSCCCWACRTATSAANCLSRRRRLSTTSLGSAAGSAPPRVRRCCPCCAPCWPRRTEPQARGTDGRQVRAAFLASKAARCHYEQAEDRTNISLKLP